MRNAPSPLSPEHWMLDLFSSKAARSGAVIRRKARDIERYVGMSRFLNECSRRGYQAIANADQVIIICNQAPLRRLNTPFSYKENEPETLKVSGPRSA